MRTRMGARTGAKTKLVGLVAVLGLGGCAATASPGPNPESVTPPGGSATSAVDGAAPGTVTVTGQVRTSAGVGLASARVLRVPEDPYLDPVLSTQTGGSGDFVLDGVEGDAREWFYLQLTGYTTTFQAVDTTAATTQAVPAMALLSDAEATARAAGYGVVIDSTKSVVRIPVMVAGGPSSTGATVTVTFDPALDVPVQYADGEAIAFNVVVYDSYRVTVTRAGRLCVPDAHPAEVAADGSVEVRPVVGTWTIGPQMDCD